MSENGADSFRPDDQAFVESLLLARQGTSDGIGRLLEHCRPYLLAIAQAELPGDLQAKIGASDLVQDTLARGIERLEEFRGNSPEEFASWLRRILLNQLADAIRSFNADKRNVSREQPPDSKLVDAIQLAPSGEALLREDERRLEEALQRLPSDYQTVIRLRHREDRSFAEIGVAMNRSEDAASKLWARAVQRLQAELR